MKTTTIDGFSARPALTEIAPESPGAANDFIGLNAGYVGGFVGEAAAAELYRIEHELLDHGTHFKWLYRALWYTPEGLRVIVDTLRLRGHAGAALALSRHIAHKIEQAGRRHDNAVRWDLRSEVMA